jgi:hypothetical protein
MSLFEKFMNGFKVLHIADPSPTLPFVRGGSYCKDRIASSSGLSLWRKVLTIAAPPLLAKERGWG